VARGEIGLESAVGLRDQKVQQLVRKIMWMKEEHPELLNPEFLSREIQMIASEEYAAGVHDGFASGSIYSLGGKL
jgi:hypothetical protein